MPHSDVEKKLSSLDHKGKAFFSLLCAERQMDCIRKYKSISEKDYLEISCNLDAGYQWIITDDVDEDTLKKSIGKILLMTPEIDEKSDNKKLQVVHALNCVVYALELVLNDDLFNATFCSQSSLESIYLSILSSSENPQKESLKSHSLYKKEVLKQKVDIEFIKQHSFYDKDFLTEVRISNQICMVPPVV